MSGLKVGFSSVNITPMNGISITGYYEKRYAEKVLDELEIEALALNVDKTTVIMLAVDNLLLHTHTTDAFKESIMQETGIPKEAIYIHATHTHTGPQLDKNAQGELEQEYFQLVYRKIAEVSKSALEDLKTAKVGYGTKNASEIAFVRRFRMKDGSVRTNPGVNNPEILFPIGDVDERVHVVRFDRENAETIILVNFANHPDVISGSNISADWPGFVRKYVERAFPNSKCIFFNGAEGDVNHINVHPSLQESDILSDSGRGYGYEHCKYIARAITGCVMQIFDKVKRIETDEIRYQSRKVMIPTNKGLPEEIANAHRLHEMYTAGQVKELREMFPGMLYETKIAEAARIVSLENSPDCIEVELSALSLGKIAFIGLPGEPFSAIGKAIKETEGWELVIPTCITNGYAGYFPMQDSYLEGGYEAASSRFKIGVGELMIEEGKKLLNVLTKK